ncbi:MAG TPA: hypothetical protein ENK71_02110 [Epsilonproteobacteria bacterium]|nr:hypothetical protein [Campylobacterota bacterium]
MKETKQIPHKKIEKLAKRMAKTFSLTQEEALELINEEMTTVEALFEEHKKVKSVHQYLVDKINYTYISA